LIKKNTVSRLNFYPRVLTTLATADIPSGYILVGVLGGMAFAPYYQTDETLLSKLNQISDKDWDTMT